MNWSGCDSSYVGMTSRHLITRLKEHFLPDGVMTKHLKTCQTSLDPFTCGKILAKTNRNVLYLSILEALHIREEKPNLNVKDEFKGRLLRIRIWHSLVVTLYKHGETLGTIIRRRIITRFISIICIVNYNIPIIIVKVFAEEGRVSEIYSTNNKLLVILLFTYSNIFTIFIFPWCLHRKI